MAPNLDRGWSAALDAGCGVCRAGRTVGEVRITTQTLPNGKKDSTYAVSLAATGGNASYSWSIVAGALPPGLTLNSSSGLISGTAQTAGSFDFRVKVTSGPLSDEKNLGILIEQQTVLEWNFEDDLEGWSTVGNVIQRSVDCREVARMDRGSVMSRTVVLPANVTTLEMLFSAHNQPGARANFSAMVGVHSTEQIIRGLADGPGHYSWITMDGNLAQFAGQTVTIIVQQFNENHGQLYIDRVRIY